MPEIQTYNCWSVIGELSAIWRDTPCITGDMKPQVRLAPGEKLRIENGKLADCSADAPANHEVIGCYGNINNSALFLHLRNLKTGTCILLDMVRQPQTSLAA